MLIRDLPRVPSTNIEAFERLYAVEVSLREFTRQTLADTYGHRWQRRCIPPDVKDAMKRGIDRERARAWYHVVPHDSLYYCDFADLKKIVLRKDNWNGAFKKYFHDDTVFEGVFQQLESIRNRTAHNRLVSENDVEAVTGALALLCDRLGESVIAALLGKANRTCNIRDMLLAIKHDFADIYVACSEHRYVALPMSSYESLSISGYFDADFLGPRVSSIEEAHNAVETVAQFPLRPGTGHRLEALVREIKLFELLRSAQESIDAIISGGASE